MELGALVQELAKVHWVHVWDRDRAQNDDARHRGPFELQGISFRDEDRGVDVRCTPLLIASCVGDRNNIAAWFGRIDRRIGRVMTIRICSNRHSGDEQGAQDASRHSVHVVSEVVLEVGSRATGFSSIVLPHQQPQNNLAFFALGVDRRRRLFGFKSVSG